jgi:oligosaccharyltransferase complex subunit beta
MTPSINSFRNPGLSHGEILDFFDSGRNVHIALDENSKNLGRELLKEFGAQLYPSKTELTGDSKQTKVEGVDSEILAWTNNFNSKTKKTITSPDSAVLYSGTGMKLDEKNSYVFPILQGDIDMVARLPVKKIKGKDVKRSFAAQDIVLVAGYQSRYSQRAVMSGSINLCSDEFIKTSTSKGKDHTTSANFQFCMDVLNWNFQQKSVLKMENFSHSLVDKSLVESGRQKNQEYKLKDEIQVSFDLFEKVDNKWVPYNANDVHLEFIMLHPWIDRTMENPRDGHFRTQFHVPDHNGVYKFKVDYNDIGLSRIYYDEITPVRVFNHDEFPTYDPKAYPYFGAVYAVIVAFGLFSFSFMTLGDQKPQKGNKGKVKQE